MSNISLLLPVFAMVLLTFIAWVAMFLARVSSMKESNVDIEEMASHSAHSRLSEKANVASEHLINLFELPVLFYVLVALLIISNTEGSLYCLLAWVFVGFRYAHSIVALSYNTVMHRFVTYLLSSIALWAAWVVFAIDVIL